MTINKFGIANLTLIVGLGFINVAQSRKIEQLEQLNQSVKEVLGAHDKELTTITEILELHRKEMDLTR